MLSLISSRDHCQKFLQLKTSNKPQAGFKTVHNQSSDLKEYNYEVVIITTSSCQVMLFYLFRGDTRMTSTLTGEEGGGLTQK